MAEFKPPEGFTPYSRSSPLLAPWLPFWIRELPDQVQLGVGARKEHCNSRGLVHGGFYAALADQAMGLTTGGHIMGLGLPMQSLLTASISLDYIASARPGQWKLFDTYYATGGQTIWFATLPTLFWRSRQFCAGSRTSCRRLPKMVRQQRKGQMS